MFLRTTGAQRAYRNFGELTEHPSRAARLYHPVVRMRVSAFALLIGCIGFAVPAAAQEPHEQPRLKMPIVLWTAAVSADQITTYTFLNRHDGLLHEQNPLVRGLEPHPAAMLAAGSAIDAASGWAAWRLLGRRHPRVATMVFIGAAAYRAYLTGHNVQSMRRAQAGAAAQSGVR